MHLVPGYVEEVPGGRRAAAAAGGGAAVGEHAMREPQAALNGNGIDENNCRITRYSRAQLIKAHCCYERTVVLIQT